ncbi:MAG TPA: HD domain-containing protein [Spirochaetota bacterium]|nr:HD domain-containing protein [Spirochaetota bacterium]
MIKIYRYSRAAIMTVTGKTDRSMILNECLEAMGVVLEYDIKDYPMHQHAMRVGEGCVLIGEKLGLQQKTLQSLYYAGLLHDIGKIAVDIKLLSKRDVLKDWEFDLIKKHAIFGSRIIASLPELKDLSLWIRWHHEKWDGSGYPDGLKGEEIPVEVQILSAVDCLDSLQTPRLDRDRLTPEQAFDIIHHETGTHFNPEIMELVLEMVKEKTLIPGKPSTRFLTLKKQYVNIPMLEEDSNMLDGYSMSGFYHVLRLFARVIDAKHQYTAGHSARVAVLSKYLAQKIGLPRNEVNKVEIAGLLHDAGKVSIPNEILDKDGQPDDIEWSYIKGHPVHSFDILSKISSLQDIAEIAHHHHERLDGSGYPCSLSGDTIHLLSQIIAIADTYDAITSTRTYRRGQSPEAAYDAVRKGLGIKYNREVGLALLATPPKYISALFDMYLE